MAERKNRQNTNKIFALLEVFNRDQRYNLESYSFIMAALDFTNRSLNTKRHIRGQELLDGVRDYAIEQFGPMARTVLEHWGIKTTNDIGEIVFNMIDAKLLRKSDYDSKDDFNNRFDFKNAFDKACKYTF